MYTTIEKSVDASVTVRAAYHQWTQFAYHPGGLVEDVGTALGMVLGMVHRRAEAEGAQI